MFTLAITGRPNVGKSTLFNSMAGKKLAITDNTPGVTRDWREAEGYIGNRLIRLLDTAGLEEEFDDSIRGRMRTQTESALKQADAVLFLVDGKSGLTPLDEHFASWLRKKNIPVIVIVNKCENERLTQSAVAEAHALGLGQPIPISAAHNLGIAEIHDALSPFLPELEQNNDKDKIVPFLSDEEIDALEGINKDILLDEDDDPCHSIKLAIVGRPNVGKSTLVNSLLGEHRVMTGPEAGITRDAIAIEWEYMGRSFRLVDTAGLRKKSKVQNVIEKMSVDDSFRAIRLAQVVILVLDANAALEKQDLQIAEHVVNEGRALVIALNKWDNVTDKKELLERFQHKLERSLSQVKQVPFEAISALNNKNLDKLMGVALNTYKIWNSRTSTGHLNRWLSSMESQHPAPLVQGKSNRLKYIAQIKSRPPTFALWISRPKDLPESYKRYLVNGLREEFCLPGIPIRLLIRTSKNPYK